MLKKRLPTNWGRNFLGTAILAMAAIGCETQLEPVEKATALDPNETYVTLNEVQVRIPTNVPQEVFGQKFDKYMAFFDEKIVNKVEAGVRVAGKEKSDWGLLTLDEIIKEIQKVATRYPDLSQHPLKGSDLAQIRRDFPNFETEADIDQEQV